MSKRLEAINPILAALMVLVLDTSVGIASGDFSSVQDDSLLESNNGEGDIASFCEVFQCEDKDRSPDFSPLDSGPPTMEFGWWYDFWSDSDSNGIDDRLQQIIEGERESVSKTSIIGQDGRSTVAIIVHYAWHPGTTDIDSLREVIESHGWENEGSWFMPMDHLDAIVLDHVPVSSLLEILSLDGVVLVEEQNVISPYLDKATKGSKVRQSELYNDAIRGLGYHGSGIVIAILDTGVDNEHFSLDDFSDDNNDNSKEPDDLDDPKWVAGCDSTGVGQSGCSEEDPDDGDGHGTHVAGIALGTGDSSREVQGYAPGSFLVDVKVMEDYGGGNSQSILAGLQWVINNKDTDWGNNESSKGIQIVSMSFGRASNGATDNNEDGTSAEANLVNQASESGLVCVAAIGNDGANNVNSVGSADTAITVGWLDDKNSIDREDDQISSSSNYGPRQDDDDGDSYDEMKPWVVAPGSNINSARHAESTGIIPGSDVNRAKDEYVQKSGSSMSTPAVAGLIAIMMEIGETRNMDFMKAEDGSRSEAIREYLMAGSEFRDSWSTDDTYQGYSWNEKYGFGIIDGSLVASEMFGTGGGGGGGGETNQSLGPGSPQEGHWVEIESPARHSWLVEGESYNLRGHIDEDGEDNGTIEEVLVRVRMSYREEYNKPTTSSMLVDWTNPIGIVNWTVPFVVPELPEDYSEVMIYGEVAARNDIGRWSNTTEYSFPVGRVNVTLESPSGLDEVSGTIQVRGQFQSIYNATIQWRLDSEDWEDGAFYTDGTWDEYGLDHHSMDHPYCVHMFREQDGSSRCVEGDYGWTDWSFNWDTTSVKDDEYRLSIRLVSATGVVTEQIRRFVLVDNVPPMPDLQFVSSSISVQEFGIPMKEAYVNTFLEVRATMRNTGDKAATDVGIILEESGSRKDEYVISNIDTGEFVDIVLYWNPITEGDAQIQISIDPYNSIQELDDSNNLLSGTFPVLPRPEGIDLAIRSGSIATNPAVPRPGEQVVIETRVDNLGSTNAGKVVGTLEEKTDRGWEQIGNSSTEFILGGSHSTISFFYVPNGTGPREIRINAIAQDDSDIDWSNNELEKTILVDTSTLTGPRAAELNPGEEPVKIISIDKEEGDILISEKEGVLYLYRLTPAKSLVQCTNIMEDRWSGDLAVYSTKDSFAHLVWTRRYLDSNGFLMQTVSYSTIDPTCRMAPIQDLLSGMPLSDGKFWGVDIDVKETEIVVAGYHRDLFSGGTLDDVTNIFTIYADAPVSSSDWTLNPSIISDIDVPPSLSDPLAIEFGDEQGHILYQTVRNDTTGIDRLGLWYAHGEISDPTWSYKKAIGDEASFPQMKVIVEEDEEDRIVAIWREGESQVSELVSIVADSKFKANEGMETRISARGMTGSEIVETANGLQIIFDRVGPYGPQVEFGKISHEENWIGLSNVIVTSGRFGMADRSPELGESMVVVSTSSGWQIRSLIDDESDIRNTDFVDNIRTSLGLDQESFEILVIGVAFAVLILGMVTLVSLSAQGIRWIGRRRAMDNETEVLMEDDVVDLVEDSSIPVDSHVVELVDSVEEDVSGTSARKGRRKKRAASVSTEVPDAEIVLEDASEIPEPEIPHDFNPAIDPGGSVICANCGGRFAMGGGVAAAKCPICGEKVKL
tara:strand:- start:11933 stop:16843 length:4911 start_codon:yes stop_codon:yes gene_type:complete